MDAYRSVEHMERQHQHRIGTIIAAHTGPGTVAVFYWGSEDRPPRDK